MNTLDKFQDSKMVRRRVWVLFSKVMAFLVPVSSFFVIRYQNGLWLCHTAGRDPDMDYQKNESRGLMLIRIKKSGHMRLNSLCPLFYIFYYSFVTIGRFHTADTKNYCPATINKTSARLTPRPMPQFFHTFCCFIFLALRV